MASRNTQTDGTGFLTVTAGEALEANRAVKWDSTEDQVVYCAAGGIPCGVTQEKVASGAPVLIKQWGAPGTQMIECATSFSAMDAFYMAASGKISSSVSGLKRGTVMSAASGSASIVVADVHRISVQVTRTRALDMAGWRLTATLLQLAASAGSGVLGLVAGTLGSAAAALVGNDAGGTTKTDKARRLIEIPEDYVAGSNLTLTLMGGMNTTVSDGTATVDIVAYRADKSAGVGSDLCATAAQSINSLTNAAKAFTITGTTLSPGDWLDVEITLAVTDSGDAGVMVAECSDTLLTWTGTDN